MKVENSRTLFNDASRTSLLGRSIPILDLLTKNPLYGFFGFLLLACAIYSPALQGEPIWDDWYLVGSNPFFKSPIFGLEVFRQYLFIDSYSTYYRPVQNLSYMLDYYLWRGNPFGYHLSNVIFHATSGFLLFKLLLQLLPTLNVTAAANALRCRTAAFAVAVLWLVHPVHNAAVAYISGRADSLASVFALGAWLLYLKARTTAGGLRLALFLFAAASALAALCSKEIALVWLGLFLFYTLFFDKSHSSVERAAAASATVCITLCYWLLRALPTASGQSLPFIDPFPTRILLMLRALGDYVSLLMFPAKLYMERMISSPEALRGEAAWQDVVWLEYLSVIGLVTLVAFAAFCCRRGTDQRLRIFAIGWFAIGFLPISNLLPLNAEVAEHWIYMPSIGLLLLASTFALSLRSDWQKHAVSIVALVAICFALRTTIRAHDWADPEIFCTRTIQDGGPTPRILTHLAFVYSSRGEHEKAEKLLRKTATHFPAYATARIGLGISLLEQDKTEEGEQILNFSKEAADEIARTCPYTWSATINLAQLYCSQNKSSRALEILDEAISRHPDVWDLVQLKAKVLQQRQGSRAAIPFVENFVRQQWWRYDAALSLGRLKAAVGDAEAAIEAFRHAAKLDIYNPEPLSLIAFVQMNQQQLEAAHKSQLLALRRDPNQPRQYLFLANILGKMNRRDEATRAIAKAENLQALVAQPAVIR